MWVSRPVQSYFDRIDLLHVHEQSVYTKSRQMAALFPTKYWGQIAILWLHAR